MRMFLTIAMLLGLACAGAQEAAPPVEETEAAPVAEPVGELAPVASYASNVYGVCRKYTDCGCNPYGSVAACREEFGASASVFPDDVWTCVLARDCESLCGSSAGACFEIYALKTAMAEALGDQELPSCPAGQSALHHFDASGNYLSTDCK